MPVLRGRRRRLSGLSPILAAVAAGLGSALLGSCSGVRPDPEPLPAVYALAPAVREELTDELVRVIESGGPIAVAVGLPEPRRVDEFLARALLLRIGPTVLPKLDRLFDASDPRIRLAAIDLARALGDPAAGPRLVRLAARDERPEVAARALVVAAELDADGAVPIVLERLRENHDPVRTGAAVTAAQILGRREFVPALIAALELWPPGEEPPVLMALKEITNYSLDEGNWPPGTLRILKTDRPRLIERWKEWWRLNAGRSLLDWALAGVDADITELLHWRAGSLDFTDGNLRRYTALPVGKAGYPGLFWKDAQGLHDQWRHWWSENYRNFDVVAAQLTRLRGTRTEAADAGRVLGRVGDARAIPGMLEALATHGLRGDAHPELLALIAAVRRISSRPFPFPLGGDPAARRAALDDMAHWMRAANTK
ncbi:MAG: hypothetical protein HZA54_17840 [Planctomycetes bacterium]|nr:hypothetical protein [Planctomycetota bacterium]